MKYSQQIGVIAALALIGVCFMPWIYVEQLNLTLNGLNGKISDSLTFGRQFIPHTFFCCVLIILFLVPKVWAKRVNLFFGFLNLSWAIKNYIIFSMCRPNCPQVKAGLYLLVAIALVIQVCVFLPKIAISQKQ